MPTNNSSNQSAAGLANYNGTGTWSGVTLTQHYALLGSTNNSITSVNPGSTAGVALVSSGTGDPAFSTVVVAGGGTGLATLTAYELLAAGTTSTGNLQQISLGTSGQVLTSAGAGALASFQTFTPSTMSPYTNVTGTTQIMAVNTGYISNNSGLVTFTPPATCAVGTIFAVAGNGAGGWTINLATNTQTMNYGNAPGTTALASSNQYDSVRFVCTVANTTFSVLDSQGNLNIS